MAPASIEFEGVETTVGTAAVTVYERLLHGRDSLVDVVVSNTGAAALDSYTVEVKKHRDDLWLGWLADTDFNTLSARLRDVSTERPHSLSATTDAYMRLDLTNAYAERHQAAAATSTTTVLVRGRSSSND